MPPLGRDQDDLLGQPQTALVGAPGARGDAKLGGGLVTVHQVLVISSLRPCWRRVPLRV
ncbi:hypothetical protein [Streptomyces sp. RK9]|uniref:hypothetical protein n=1 Tax=Streptomyces sp. RK9 TaxID=3239284 RepID=UPI003862F2BF